jgi:hypothetical protein
MCQPTNYNNKLWKLKIPLRIKVFGWYLRKGVILTKNNLAKRNWHGSRKYVFCHQDETIKYLFFQCRFARSIWSVVQVALTLYPPQSVIDFLGTGSVALIISLKSILGWEQLLLFDRYSYLEMINCLTIKTFLFCRLSIGIPVLFVYGRLYSG